MIRWVRLAMAAVLAAGCAPAYYHFVHFSSRVGPFRPIPEKFDLNLLGGKTLNYFVDSATGVQLASGDSYTSLVSEIRAAAEIWNGVDSSDLRLSFGGFVSPGSLQTTPSV